MINEKVSLKQKTAQKKNTMPSDDLATCPAHVIPLFIVATPGVFEISFAGLFERSRAENMAANLQPEVVDT